MLNSRAGVNGNCHFCAMSWLHRSLSLLTPSSFATIDIVYTFTSDYQFTADIYIVYIFQLKSLRTLGWYVRAQGEAHCTLRSLCAGEGTRAFHHPQMIVYSFTTSTVYKFTFLTFEFTHPGLPNS